jgi:hypothetical protein
VGAAVLDEVEVTREVADEEEAVVERSGGTGGDIVHIGKFLHVTHGSVLAHAETR